MIVPKRTSRSDATKKSRTTSAETPPPCRDVRSARLRGQVVAQLGFEGARHLVSERLPSARRSERIVGVRLPDLSLETTDCVRALRSTLRRVDISGLRLASLPNDVVGELPFLERLDVSRNELTELVLPADAVATVGAASAVGNRSSVRTRTRARIGSGAATAGNATRSGSTVVGSQTEGAAAASGSGTGSLRTLFELLAYGNRLIALPSDLADRLASLRRLNVAQNRLVAWEPIVALRQLQVLVVDDNRLPSMPPTFYENLRHLEVFHAARNDIADLSPAVGRLRHLRDVALAGNRLAAVPAELLQLPRLEAVDLSGNAVSRVPTVRLRGPAARRPPLATVDLSDNELVRFPEQLFAMTRRLDVAGNRIRTVPMSVEKCLASSVVSSSEGAKDVFGGAAADDDRKLRIDDNPLQCPPPDVCAGGMPSIIRFFQEARVRMQSYQGVKVLVVGATGAGKTSLVQTLVDQQSRLTDDDERTVMMDLFEHDVEIDDRTPAAASTSVPEEEEKAEDNKETVVVENRTPSAMKNVDRIGGSTTTTATETTTATATADEKALIGKRLQMSIFDFSGNVRYAAPLYRFLDRNAVTLLVFSLAEYADGNDDEDAATFRRLVGTWIDWFIARNNRVILLPVGTQADRVAPARRAEIRRRVGAGIVRHLSAHAAFIDGEIRRIESEPHIVSALSEHLKRCLDLKKIDAVVNDDVLEVSALHNTGMDALVEAVRRLATDRAVFPNVLRPIPALWDQVERFVEERGAALEMPYLAWSDYDAQVSAKFGLRRLLPQITQYLHDTGKVYWFPESSATSPATSRVVVLRPGWLVEVLRSLLRYADVPPPVSTDTGGGDVPSVLQEIDTYSLKQTGLTAARFDRLRSELSRHGVAERDLLRHSWCQLLASADLNRPLLELAALVVEGLELGYALPKGFQRDSDNAAPPEIHRRSAIAAAGGGGGSGGRKTPTVDRSDTSSMTSTTEGSRPEVDRSRTGTAGAVAGAVPHTLGSFVVCCMRKTAEPAYLREGFVAADAGDATIAQTPPSTPPRRGRPSPSSAQPQPRLVAVFRFPRYTPPGVVDSLVIAAQSPRHGLATVTHWRAGFYAYHRDRPIRLLVRQIADRASTSTATTNGHPLPPRSNVAADEDGIEMESASSPDVPVAAAGDETRDDGDDGDDDDDGLTGRASLVRVEVTSDDATTYAGGAGWSDEMWHVLSAYLVDVDSLLARYAGVYVERRMECPLCLSASFVGEWQTPKQLQSQWTAVCPACRRPVETSFLVQPKEKRVVDQFLLKMAERQRLNALNAQNALNVAVDPAPSGILTSPL